MVLHRFEYTAEMCDCRYCPYYRGKRKFSILKDRFANLDELNYLAKRMESFDYHEYDQFLIGITKLQNPTEKDLINLTFNLDHFTLCKDVSSYGKIGREYVMNTQGAVPAHDEDDPKYAAIGKDLIDRGLAQITAKGLLIYNPFDELTEVYDGQAFPEYFYENTLASAEVSYNGRTELLLLPGEEGLHGGHAAVDEQQAGVVLRDEREAVQTQVALALKEGKVLVTQFIQTGPLHSFNLSSCIGVLLRTQFLWQSGKKQKTALIPKRDEGCLKSSVVPPKLQKCRRGAPAALCAVTLRSVRFVSPEAPGWRKKCSAGTPFSQGRSLWAAAHILLAPSLPFAIITIHAQRACCSFAFISDYSIVRPFVNGFSQKSRVTVPRCGGYC